MMKRIVTNLLFYFYSKKRYQYLINELDFENEIIKILGLKICVFKKTSNKKKNIILLHGLLDLSFGFRKIVKHLQDDFNIYLIDMPGFGKSKFPKIEYLYQFCIFAKLIFELILKLKLENLHLAGHSMGGLLAQHISLLDKSKNIKKLILISSPCYPHTEREKFRNILFPKNYNEFDSLLKYLYLAETPNLNFIEKSILISFIQSEEFKYLESNTIRQEDEIFHGDKIKEIKIPTLILSGFYDEIITPKMAEKMNHALPHSHLYLIDNAKHALHLEKPKEVANFIIRFSEEKKK